MKYTILILLTCIIFTSCKDSSNGNEKIYNWIKEHKKPIFCIKSTYNGLTNEYSYTLRDSNNEFYLTDDTYLTLPDTIK